MKKLIILFIIMMVLVVGCKSYAQPTENQQPTQNPAIGSGCGVAENENSETKIKYVEVVAGL